jgi:hypothetical protein
MDSNERADTLLAQLDILLAMGRIDAARALGEELRAQLRESSLGRPSGATLERRDVVLRPLAAILRRQRALNRDLTQLIDEIGPRPREIGGDAGPAGRSTDEKIAEIEAAFEALVERRSGVSALRLATVVARSLGTLKHAVQGSRADVQAALEGLRDLLDPRLLGDRPGTPPDPQTLFLLDTFLEEARTRTGIRELDRLVARQVALLHEVEPVRDGPAASLPRLSGMRRGLMETADAMARARDRLGIRLLDEALGLGQDAADGMATAMRWVADALGAPKTMPGIPAGFVGRYMARRLPSWEFPDELAAAAHDAIDRGDSEGELRRELVVVVHRLTELTPAETVVRTRESGTVGADRRTIEVPVVVDRQGERRRYVVVLDLLVRDGIPRPAPGERPPVGMTYGGCARRLFSAVLPEARVSILRLEELGPGPRIGFVDVPDLRGVQMAHIVRRGVRAGFKVEETRPGPVQGQVLAWIDSLVDQEEEGPVAVADLRALGLPTYDTADLADLLRPVHEGLEFEILAPRGNTQDFPGLAWEDQDAHAFFAVHLGADGATPTIVVPRSLLRYLGWTLKHNVAEEDRPTLPDMLAAVQLHLGLKLAFFDRILMPGDHAVLHRAARAVERAFLESRGLHGDVVRDLFTRIAMQHAGAVEGQGVDDTLERWSRAATDLFEERGGEELLKASRMPMSALFGAYRESLVRGLARQGRTRAAKSAKVLEEFQDAALLFGNLVRDPETGSGVLIVGDSKLGKSSIAARLATGRPRHGVPAWEFGGNDRILVLTPPGAEPVATASPAHRKFGQWIQELWYRDADHREIRPADQVVRRGLIPVRVVVFVHRDGGEFRAGGPHPAAIAEMLRDFQARFGFGANRRFWWTFLSEVALAHLPMRRRGPDSFHHAAEQIRSLVAALPRGRGDGRPDARIVECDGVWFSVSGPPGPVRVARVGADGMDIEYTLRWDGSASARPAQIGREIELQPIGGYRIEDVSGLVDLDPDRFELHHGRPQYRIAAGRWMPLSAEYFRTGLAGPQLFIPGLPTDVLAETLRRMEADDPGRWQRWFRAGPISNLNR